MKYLIVWVGKLDVYTGTYLEKVNRVEISSSLTPRIYVPEYTPIGLANLICIQGRTWKVLTGWKYPLLSSHVSVPEYAPIGMANLMHIQGPTLKMLTGWNIS